MTRYEYAISTVTTGTAAAGTISSTGTAIVGVSTNFDPAVPVGSIITVNGIALVVATVTDDTHLTVVTAPAVDFSAQAFSVLSLTNVETLGVVAPKSTFKPWAGTVDLGNGLSRALGRPSAVWSWGFMSSANRNALRAYCTGKSSRVYIRTRKNDSSDAYAVYSAVMLWPDDEERFANRRLNFAVEFRDLVAL